jgi:hypothetical protein
MKTSTLILLLLVLFSCTPPNPADIAIKNRFCVDMIFKNENTMKMMEHYMPHGQDGYQDIYNDEVKIVSLRSAYLKNASHRNLTIYADSVNSRFKKVGLDDKVVETEIVRNKQMLSISGDSTSVLNLLFWSLTAELAIHEEALQSIGILDRLITSIPAYVSKVNFSLGDTIMISVGFPYTSDNSQLDFENVTCINSKTKNAITPKIYHTGPISFLIYQPKEAGDYIVHGPVKLIQHRSCPGLESSLLVNQRFKVVEH